jgi:hypothetical protein
LAKEIAVCSSTLSGALPSAAMPSGHDVRMIRNAMSLADVCTKFASTPTTPPRGKKTDRHAPVFLLPNRAGIALIFAEVR